jgi:hypothetical protein
LRYAQCGCCCRTSCVVSMSASGLVGHCSLPMATLTHRASARTAQRQQPHPHTLPSPPPAPPLLWQGTHHRVAGCTSTGSDGGSAASAPPAPAALAPDACSGRRYTLKEVACRVARGAPEAADSPSSAPSAATRTRIGLCTHSSTGRGGTDPPLWGWMGRGGAQCGGGHTGPPGSRGKEQQGQPRGSSTPHASPPPPPVSHHPPWSPHYPSPKQPARK